MEEECGSGPSSVRQCPLARTSVIHRSPRPVERALPTWHRSRPREVHADYNDRGTLHGESEGVLVCPPSSWRPPLSPCPSACPPQRGRLDVTTVGPAAAAVGNATPHAPSATQAGGH